MERKEILEKLKSTEAEIRSNIEVAQHKRNEILARTQKQAQKLEEDGERQIRDDREKSLNAARKEIEKKRAARLKKATMEAEDLKKKAQVQKAKEIFLEKFQEYIHV
jgi:vacuolar-type H+-ATPase subunit H